MSVVMVLCFRELDRVYVTTSMYSCAVRCRVAACRCCLYCCLKTVILTAQRPRKGVDYYPSASYRFDTRAVMEGTGRKKALVCLSRRRLVF